MRHFLPLLFFLPLSAFAQVDQPCTPQLVISYDAAGNRIQRREVCDPIGGPGTYSSSEENFRLERQGQVATCPYWRFSPPTAGSSAQKYLKARPTSSTSAPIPTASTSFGCAAGSRCGRKSW